MDLVVRSNYGDESIALIQFIFEKACAQKLEFLNINVVYIDTGWAGKGWHDRVRQGEGFVKRCGFIPVRLKAKTNFSDLVLERKNFPSKKYQWCAGFLKGLPLISWLDEHDPECKWVIAISKRQALYRKPIEAFIPECEYHGDRQVWHPLIAMSNEERNQKIQQAGFKVLNHHSLECAPCVNSIPVEVARLSLTDQTKLRHLEQKIEKPMFPHHQVQDDRTQSSHTMDNFSMGCGDPFGCGL